MRCNTSFHQDEDARLMNVRPEHFAVDPDLMERVRRHPYNDECCQIKLVGDGQIVWKRAAPF